MVMFFFIICGFCCDLLGFQPQINMFYHKRGEAATFFNQRVNAVWSWKTWRITSPPKKVCRSFSLHPNQSLLPIFLEIILTNILENMTIHQRGNSDAAQVALGLAAFIVLGTELPPGSDRT